MTPIDLRFTVINQPLPDFIYRAMKPYVTASNRYVHQPEELRYAIARHHGIDPAMVYLVAGIDQAIYTLCSLFGTNTHIFTPTYVGYSDAKRFGQVTEHWSLDDDTYTVTTKRLAGASLIFLANPNNPAGLTPRAKILELVNNNPGAVVMIDEAYGDFGGESVIDQVATHDNLVVARSFSKGFAMAGMRVGYVVAPPRLLSQLELETAWFNVSYPAAGAALSALEHQEHFVPMREAVANERTTTMMLLKRLGYTVLRSSINAIMLHFATTAAATAFVEQLAEQKIIVHQGNGASNIGLDQTYVRVAVGTPEQMQRFRTCMEQLTA